MSLIAGRGCRWPPRRDSVSPCAPLSGGGRDTHDGHENSPILVFFSNLLVRKKPRESPDSGDSRGFFPQTSGDGLRGLSPHPGSAPGRSPASVIRCPKWR